MNDDAVPALPSSPGAAGRSRRVLLLWLPVLALVGVYLVSTTFTTLPRSALSDDLSPLTGRVMRPYFTQRWNLFAPDAPVANYGTRLQVRYRPHADGPVLTSPVLNLSDQAVHAAHGAPLAKGEMKDMAVAFMESAYPYRSQLAALGPRQRTPAAFRRSAGRDYEGLATFLDSFQRYLSSAADHEFPGAQVVGVRGEVGGDPVTPFPQRGSGQPPAPFYAVFDSGWWPYVAGVSAS